MGVSAACSVLIVLGCSRPNPAFDELVEDLAAGESGADGDLEGEETGAGEDDGAGGETGELPESDDGGGDSGSGADEPEQEGDDTLLLYSSLDALERVLIPEVGMGPGLLSDPEPEVIDGLDGQGLRTTDVDEWFAFPQHDGRFANVDHARGSLSMNVRVEFEPPHFSPRDLVSLAGVIPDGGGIRVGVAGLSDGNRLWVELIDDEANSHLTRYPAYLLNRGEWAHVKVAWRTDVEPGEPNIDLWIDGDWIEPLDGYAEGPKTVGSASPEDVVVFGSWSLGGGYSAQASFDEIELRSE